MTPYIVVQHDDIDKFTKVVNQKIREGYVPVGGIQIIWREGPYKHEYYQSMTHI